MSRFFNLGLFTEIGLVVFVLIFIEANSFSANQQTNAFDSLTFLLSSKPTLCEAHEETELNKTEKTSVCPTDNYGQCQANKEFICVNPSGTHYKVWTNSNKKYLMHPKNMFTVTVDIRDTFEEELFSLKLFSPIKIGFVIDFAGLNTLHKHMLSEKLIEVSIIVFCVEFTVLK